MSRIRRAPTAPCPARGAAETDWREKRAAMPYLDDPEHVWTYDELQKLDEYSSSSPTGTIIGKFWRRGVEISGSATVWYLCEYIDINGSNNVGFRQRLLHTTDRRLDSLATPTTQP